MIEPSKKMSHVEKNNICLSEIFETIYQWAKIEVLVLHSYK